MVVLDPKVVVVHWRIQRGGGGGGGIKGSLLHKEPQEEGSCVIVDCDLMRGKPPCPAGEEK